MNLSPSNTSSEVIIDDHEQYNAAIALYHEFPDTVIETLAAELNAAKLLKKCSLRSRMDYHCLIAEYAKSTPQRHDTIDPRTSRPIKNRSLSNNSATTTSTKGFSTSPEVASSASSTFDRPPSLSAKSCRITILQDEGFPDQPLMGRRSDRSFPLIKSDVVHERLVEQPKSLPRPMLVTLGDKSLKVTMVVALTWNWKGEDITDHCLFLLVDPCDLPNADFVLSNERLDKNILQNNAESNPYGAFGTQSQMHGAQLLQSISSTNESGSTATVTRRSHSHSFSGSQSVQSSRRQQQQQSYHRRTGSEQSYQTSSQTRSSNLQATQSSRLPRPSGSSSSSLAGSNFSDPMEPTVIHPDIRKHIPNSGEFDVILVYNTAESSVLFNLNAVGEDFYNTLIRHLRELRLGAGLALDREVDKVEFAMDERASGDKFVVELGEKRVAKTWKSAVRWILKKQQSMEDDCDIFAVIRRQTG